MTELAREYGEGLFDLAREENLLDGIHEEMNVLRGAFEGEPRYARLLQTHALSRDVRLAILDEAFRGKVHPYVLNFMKLLLERGALSALPDCARHFHARWLEEKGVVEARVTSAAPLTDAQRASLSKKLSDIAGKKVELLIHIDPAVMGGLRVDMEGRRYDNTIRHRLDLMRRHLADEA
ncbi:MAG: ATP synthase F1 subunit delta [Clostridia bacterium]|nr:ATP synthase F1 subunit delta [Clostridia bacterium]